ncbi:MAG: DUF1292 domain-containing protein [Oscillospiraceae bacterium]|nr:DUF1292 domain-containing protein [Oscillospiraceae bacterium]
MSEAENESPIFVSVIDENGKEIVIEYVDTIEYNGIIYKAFFPTVDADDENADDDDNGLIILKEIEENGEAILSTLDSEEELNAVYDEFMNVLFDDEDDADDDENDE